MSLPNPMNRLENGDYAFVVQWQVGRGEPEEVTLLVRAMHRDEVVTIAGEKYRVMAIDTTNEAYRNVSTAITVRLVP